MNKNVVPALVAGPAGARSGAPAVAASNRSAPDKSVRQFRARRSIQMRFRALVVVACLLTASAGVYGQARLTGKWQTDNVPAALEARKNPPATTEEGGRGGRGRGGPQAI